jgi:serine/threonine protein kinase
LFAAALGAPDTRLHATPEAASGAPTPADLAADFPQLEILELIGQGGMGVVYRARHVGLEREVALKILTAELSRDPRFSERFQREARALAKLDHTGIVRVHDFGRAGGRGYLVMEFVEGESLRRKLETGPLAPSAAVQIAVQLARALEYAHASGVIHRDIKPENVLIDGAGRARLADFGLAKLRGDGLELGRTETGLALGTPQYMAPEQLTRPGEVDHRADLYALGVLLYELLTGHLPLGRFEPPSRRDGVDPRIDAIVLKCLEREPQRRFENAGELCAALQSLARPVRARGATPTATGAAAPAATRPTPLARTLIASSLVLLSTAMPWMHSKSQLFGLPGEFSQSFWAWNSSLDLADLSIPFWLVAPIAVFLALEAWLQWRGLWHAHSLARAALALAAFSLSCLVLATALEVRVGLGVLFAVFGCAGLCHASLVQLGSSIGGAFLSLLTAADPKLQAARPRLLTRRFGRHG